MTPAGTSNELDVQNEWEENTHTTFRLVCFPSCDAVNNTLLMSYFRDSQPLPLVRVCSQFVPKDIVLESISFKCSWAMGPGKDFVAICIPGGLNISLSLGCDLLTFAPLYDHERD